MNPPPFRVPDRGSGNPTPLGGWDRGASKVEWLDGSVQAGRPYGLGQHLWGRGYWVASSGNVTDEVELNTSRARRDLNLTTTSKLPDLSPPQADQSGFKP